MFEALQKISKEYMKVLTSCELSHLNVDGNLIRILVAIINLSKKIYAKYLLKNISIQAVQNNTTDTPYNRNERALCV